MILQRVYLTTSRSTSLIFSTLM